MLVEHLSNKEAIKALLPKFFIGLLFGYAMGALCAHLLVEALGHYFHPAWFGRLTGIHHFLIKVPFFACLSVFFLRVIGWFGVLKQISDLKQPIGVAINEKATNVHTTQHLDKP